VPSLAECQTIFKKPELAGQLAYIRAHFADIPTIIEKLETKNLPLTDAFKLVDDFNSKLSKNNTKTCNILTSKLSDLLKKNTGLSILRKANNILNGNFTNESHDTEIPVGAEKSYIFKYCPTTSCDVERSFSSYKTILEEKRQNFLVENIERYLVIYCNK
jgi:hypothetical protein